MSRQKSRSPSTSATTTPPRSNSLEALRERSPAAGIFLDFDGSLSRIVDRPELARPVEGARETLIALVPRFRVVAIVSGRRTEEVAGLLGVSGVQYHGLYGMEHTAPAVHAAAVSRAESAAGLVPEAWVENKGPSLAVHYRQAPDPQSARAALVGGLQQVASEMGLEIVEGKMVVELVPASRPRKGGVVERLVAEHGLAAALFAGDDAADMEGFASLDRLAEKGLITVRVAVRGDETPDSMIRAADIVVDGPEGLVGLLRQIA
ncbi:MAG: trehalose-phosphatase [Actinomycetota bacterium]